MSYSSQSAFCRPKGPTIAMVANDGCVWKPLGDDRFAERICAKGGLPSFVRSDRQLAIDVGDFQRQFADIVEHRESGRAVHVLEVVGTALVDGHAE